MVMRGRWASAAIGASIARNRAGAKMDEQAESYQREIDQLKACTSTTITGSAIVGSGRYNSKAQKIS